MPVSLGRLEIADFTLPDDAGGLEESEAAEEKAGPRQLTFGRIQIRPVFNLKHLAVCYLGQFALASEAMPSLSQNQLKRIIAAAPATLPRTDALQHRIKIGVGFHNKWYRSQKEHWLGWIVFQEYSARKTQREISSILAKDRWMGLNCIPMMFGWLKLRESRIAISTRSKPSPWLKLKRFPAIVRNTGRR